MRLELGVAVDGNGAAGRAVRADQALQLEAGYV